MLAPAVLGVIVSGFAIRTWVRNQDWQTELALASHDVRVSPRSYKLHQLLAVALFEADPQNSNIDQVIAEQEKSVALLDKLPNELNRADSYRQAGYYRLLRGDLEQERDAFLSMTDYRSALAAIDRGIAIDQVSRARYLSRLGSSRPRFTTLSQGDAAAYLLLSLAHLRLGDADKAYEAVNQARTLDPLDPRMYRQLSEVLAAKGRPDDADLALIQEKAITSLQQGNWQDAADASEHVLEVNGATYPTAYYLNAMANLRLGHLDPAERSAREAVRLASAQRNPRAGYVLGLVLAEKQQFQESAALLKGYLQAMPDAPDTAVVRQQLMNIENSAKYQNHPPAGP